MSLDLETVADGLGFPEGPVAMADGSLLFVDIKNETLSRVTTDGRVDVVAEIPGGPNGVAIGPDGMAYVCNNGGVYSFVPFNGVTVPGPRPPSYQGGSVQRVDLATGAVTVLYDEYKGASCSRQMILSSITRAGSGSPIWEFRIPKPPRKAPSTTRRSTDNRS